MYDFRTMAFGPLKVSKVPYLSDAKMHRLVHEEMGLGVPETEDEAALLAARVSVRSGAYPSSERELMRCALSAAEGMFCALWHDVCDCQRWDWIDLCEWALREALAEVGHRVTP